MVFSSLMARSILIRDRRDTFSSQSRYRISTSGPTLVDGLPR